jgi:membrane associated rhomboid family serine protease/tetratricopeptide (TPR) repeat protein
MYYELALISVLVAGGYWGWYFVRHDPTRLYGALLIASAVLSGLGFLGERLDKSGLGVPGAIGVGAGACLLVVGPFARALARRFAAAERFGAAERMLGIAEVLAPGSGVSDEKALVYAMREIRDGNIDHTVDALTAAKDRAPADARLAIDERIAMLYLASYRWDDAIAHAEQHLFDAIATEPTGEPDSAEQLALRRALGIAPPVYVELMGAYGYKGDLDRAARMLARLEEVCAGRADAGIWLHRGRLIFLALAGRIDAVQTLVEPRRSRHMKPAARTYWVAVAHERRGEVDAAEAAYAKARARTRGRPRVLIDQALERLAHAKPTELGPDASEIVARVEAQPPPVVAERVRPRGPIATRVLVLAVLAYAAVIAFGLDGATDVGTLLRAGAVVRGVVDSGELWRLVTFSFVHVGAIHLIGNVLCLWFLGRIAEELFGPWRTAAIFALAGIGGATTSYLAVPAGISAGASGAIFGLLGAVFVELSLHRRRHRTAWHRGVWGGLGVLALAQIGVGFVYPVTDQWAHGGGLAIGALAAVLLSPHGRAARVTEHVARATAIVFALATIASCVLVARTSIEDSLARSPAVPRKLGTATITAPAAWQAGKGELFDPDLLIMITARRGPASDAIGAQLDAFAEAQMRHAKELELDQIEPAIGQLVELPAGWTGRELVASVADPLGGRQRFRMVVAVRQGASGNLFASLIVPETVASHAPGFFTRLLSSVQ